MAIWFRSGDGLIRSAQAVHAEVKGLMRSTFETFKADGDDVQREWSAFVSRVDQSVEDALRQVPTGLLQRGSA